MDNNPPFYNVYGGTQDNNSLGGPARTRNTAGIVNSDWFATNGGDGFKSQVDPLDPNIIYAESQNGGLVRFDKRTGERVGIEPVEDLENFVSFNIAQTCFDISVADEKSPRSYGGSVGYWLVDDIEKAISAAIELGGKVYRGPLRIDEIQRTIAQIVDPYGNVIGLEAEY